MSGAASHYQGAVWRCWIFIAVIMVGAGGLGSAAAAGLLGLMLAPLLVRPAIAALCRAPILLSILSAALAWTALSLTWSPYDRPDQALKLTLLTPLFALVVFGAAQLDQARAGRIFGWAAVLLVIAAVYFLMEALAGAPAALWVKLALENYQDPVLAAAHADRGLARGITAFLMVAIPIAIGLWRLGALPARAGAVLMIAAAAAGGFAFQVEANIAALAAGLTVAALAWRAPQRTLLTAGFGAAALLIAAPIYLGLLILFIPPSVADALPLSWHMRLEIWEYALDQIAAAPIFGHGLDASRVLGEDAVLRGEPFNTLPLHAHNFGLAIWLETGLVGAGLFAAALAAAGWTAARMRWTPATAAGVGGASTVLLVTVMVGSGVWQEWLHGSYGLGLAFAVMAGRRTA